MSDHTPVITLTLPRLPGDSALATFRSIYQHSLEAALLAQPTGEVLAANPCACAMFGASEEELCELSRGGDRTLLVDTSDPRLVELVTTRAVRGNARGEMRLRRANGQVFEAEVSSFLFRDENGLPTTILTVRDISALREAERARTLSEERLRFALDAARIGDWDIDLRTNVTVRSLQHDRLYGYTEAVPEWNIEIALMHIDERDRPRVRHSLQEATSGRAGLDVEFRAVWPDGSLHWLWASGRFFFEPDGTAYRAAGIVMDITQRRMAEESLRENEQRINVAVAGGDLGLWDFSVDTGMFFVNERWRSMLGLEPQPTTFPIELFYSLIHPDDVERVKASDAVVISDPSANDFAQDIRLRHADGHYLWFIDSGAVVERDAQGRALRFAGMHRDITRRKEAEALLIEREAALLRAQRLAHLGNWKWTRAQDVRDWSDETYRIFGIDRDSFALNSENVWKLVHPDDRGRVIEESQRAKSGLGPYDMEYRIVTPAGELKHVHTRADIVRDPATGEVTALVGTLLDITERTLQQQELAASRDELERQVEQRTHELSAARDMAEQANRAKSMFLSRMSHELRTPLNAVLGFSQLLELDPQIAASQRASAQISHIHKAGDHLLAMIDEVLDLARIETGDLRLSPEAVEIGPLVAECVTLATPLSNRYQVSIGTERMDDGFCVRADRMRLRQILVNLITNAIKYNRPGGSVTIALQPCGAQVDIAIRDTGLGMKAEQLAQMFQPFNRLGAESRDVEGTGLGLVIAKQLCEAMEGSLRVDSAVDVGSTFTVSLPAAAGAGDSHHDTTPGELAAWSEAPFRVLYVEDNPTNVALMIAALSRSEGLIVDTAASGRAGIAAALAQQPDLILLDVDLPDMSGLEVLYEMRRHESLADVPCVAVSANAMGPEVQRALDCGFDRYLTKPFSVAKLLMLVESYRAERTSGFADFDAVSGHGSLN